MGAKAHNPAPNRLPDGSIDPAYPKPPASPAPPHPNLGGTRLGAGRPRKREKHAGQVAKAEKKIADRLPEIIDNLFVLAEGVKVKEVSEDGGVDIYVKPPDRQANEYLANRVMGKPTERHKHEFGQLSDAELIEAAKALT
jgi:hypothetical protein